VIRPSFANPIFARPRTLGRARPMKCSSSRLMRIMTGAFNLRDRIAGIIMITEPVTLLPNPPPVYSLISTTWSGFRFIQRAIAGTV
jgi:hypothetical protein